MKVTFATILALLSFESFALIGAQDGAKKTSVPPVGKRKVSSCSGKNCFQLNIQPYCFGTNLRSYDSSIQLREQGELAIKVAIGGASGDKLDVKFPAALTFASDNVRTECQAQAGQNMGSAGLKKFNCTVGSDTSVYSIQDWRGSTNPSCYANGGSHGPTYCNYAARPLEANRISGANPENKVTCLYTFDSGYQLKSSVQCYFRSTMENKKDDVALKINGVDATAEVDAFTNDIAIKIPLDQLNWVNANSELSRGHRVMPKSGQSLPAPAVEFAQLDEGSNTPRPLETSDYQLPDKSIAFDEVNNNMSLTIVAKLPGAAGFCGGFYSPLMLFFDKELPEFTGVSTFPLHGVKEGGRVNWPEAGSKGYFLVNLANGEKEVSKASQLFGQDGVNSNGFESLKLHDADKNGVINNKDKVWSTLKLWQDKNSNGLSEPEELISLQEKKVVSINLNYHAKKKLSFGDRARARESSTFSYESKGKTLKADIIDVWLSPLD